MPPPSCSELRLLLDVCRSASALSRLGEFDSLELALYRVEALINLDRTTEARKYLEPLLPQFQGDELSRARRWWSEILLRQYEIDEAILSAQLAARVAIAAEPRAQALAWSAVGYAQKGCGRLAHEALRDAQALAAADPLVLLAEARICMETDERLAARAVYDRLGACEIVWAQAYACWGRSWVAFLLGDFEEARVQAEGEMRLSDETLGSIFILAHLAFLAEDAVMLRQVVEAIVERSPQAERVPMVRSMLERLEKRQAAPAARRCRLQSFPTTMQKRDCCGPSTMDLVLRYWQGSEKFTNDEIEAWVKLPHSGTPAYRMREFFHLAGFDTIRCRVTLDKLEQLIDAGYPVIIPEKFAQHGHVTVAIGYDEAENVIEFQDPTTHFVLPLPRDLVDRLRRLDYDSAIVAFPQGEARAHALARLGFFNEPAFVWADQAGLASERNDLQTAAALLQRSVQRLPAVQIAWAHWLDVEFQRWINATHAVALPPKSLASQLLARSLPTAAQARERFYSVLQRAREFHPKAAFISGFEGQGALEDGQVALALTAFKRAGEIEPDDSANYASVACCHFGLRAIDEAMAAAKEALRRDPRQPGANAWLARCLAQRHDDTAAHYALCAVELSPNWWIAHLALAEARIEQYDSAATRRELDIALALSPGEPEVLVRRGVWKATEGWWADAAHDLEESLAGTRPLPLNAEYEARQTLGRLLFSRNKFHLAAAQAQGLLARAPGDPWALQFYADARSRALLEAPRKDANISAQVRGLYEPAVEANRAAGDVVERYLECLAQLKGDPAALEVLSRLRQAYPDQAGLLFLQAVWLGRTGQSKRAVRAMWKALKQPGSIQDSWELSEAAATILNAWGMPFSEKAFLATRIPEAAHPLHERRRALALVLASNPSASGPRARELLQEVLAAAPDDVGAMVRLGDVTEAAEEREALYRRALRLAPGRPFARAALAIHLFNAGREDEALEFTAGHEAEDTDILRAHGRALLSLGRYEEAAAAYSEACLRLEASPAWLYEDYWSALNASGDHHAASEVALGARKHYPKETRWYYLAALSLAYGGQSTEADNVLQQGFMSHLSLDEYLAGHCEIAWAEYDLPEALRRVESLRRHEENVSPQRLSRWEKEQVRVLLALHRANEVRQLVGGKELDLQGWREAVGVVLNGGLSLSEWDLLGEWVERLLALDPKDYMGQLARAGALIETGSVAEAAAAYAELRTAHPYEHTAYEQLGLLSALDGRLDEALELADSALNLGQTCCFAWATRGYVYFLRGQWLAAEADLKTAWNRASMAERRSEFVYWWILAELQNDRWLASDRKMKAHHETHNDWRRHQLAQTQAQLKVWAADPSRRRTLRQRWAAFRKWLAGAPLRARSAAARLAHFARRTGLGRLKTVI